MYHYLYVVSGYRPVGSYPIYHVNLLSPLTTAKISRLNFYMNARISFVGLLWVVRKVHSGGRHLSSLLVAWNSAQAAVYLGCGGRGRGGTLRHRQSKHVFRAPSGKPLKTECKSTTYPLTRSAAIYASAGAPPSGCDLRCGSC